jgi:hypothetical protein
MRSGEVSILAMITVGSKPVTGAQSRERFAASRALIPGVVFRVHVFKAQRSNRGHLRDVFARLSPMEVPGIAGEYDNTAGRIRLDFVAVELIAEADVEHTDMTV